MIPKIIYYCWFGSGEKSTEINEYINDWRRILSDYQIVEINENNFDVNKYKYTKEAYEQKKYAFVSDVARIEFLHKTGGFYFDTDIKLLKPLDEFVNYTAVFGFESSTRVMTAFMGAVPFNNIFRLWLDEYKERAFVTSEGVDVTTNVESLTKLLKERYSLKLNGKTQLIDDNVIVCASCFFSPKDYETGIIKETEDIIMIHDFSGSWKSCDQLKKEKNRAILIRIMGINNFWRLIRVRDSLKSIIQRKSK